ncbi:multi-copper polyphenol oxidoreductase [Vibrio navarrensis]|uniref:peptidoglycan editing factor PgeF n=1 Tax=Vibrio navarrensis TaxID=29495 RepID=UPI0018691DF8|nr:peptidoglycan editing factor PgeF [Vibrio navarrensis]MBE3658041.1 multi-copper polyphenol oxidoreductase [Vibrio navarrensis]
MILPNWPASKNIKAFASTREGGFSHAPYTSLNLGAHVGDELHLVRENRLWLAQKAQMPSAPVWLNQTHSTRVVEVSTPTDQVLDADGLFTQTVGVVCSAMTADCLPLLITNTQGTQVAAVHAGWRGLSAGIVENALDKFCGEVMVWLGPAIGPLAFEVGDDVRQAFADFDPQAAKAFVAQEKSGKWLADIFLLATQRLNRAGVGQVFSSQMCTYSNSGQFFSYRRDGVTGRQASFIWMEE